jgi:hypothetical protein
VEACDSLSFSERCLDGESLCLQGDSPFLMSVHPCVDASRRAEPDRKDTKKMAVFMRAVIVTRLTFP